MENETAVLGSSLNGALELAMLGQRRDELEIMLQHVVADSELLRVFILNNRGEVKLSSDSNLLGKKFQQGEGRCAYCHISRGRGLSPAATAYHNGENSFWSARPIVNQVRCQPCHPASDHINGMLVVERSLSSFRQEIANEKRELAQLSLEGFVVAALVLIPLINLLVVSRLRHLAGQAARIRGDDLDHALTVRGRDVIADLGHSLEAMRLRLRSSLQEVQTGRDYLEKLMDSVHEGILVVDANLRVQRVNRAWCEISGKEAAEILGKACMQLCAHAEGQPPEYCPAHHCFERGQEGWAIHTLTDAQGTLRHLEVHCTPLRDQVGKVVEVVEVTRDISKRRELESQLLHAERLSSVGRLAAGVAHEINNPIASIVASAEGLQRRFSRISEGQSPPSLEDIDDYLNTIRQAGRRCRDVTQKLLNFSRKDSAKLELVNLCTLAEDAVMLVKRSAPEACQFILQLEPELPLIKGSPGELTQLIFNLVLNAADAVGEKGEIRITTATHTCGVSLAVEDSGPGIPEAELSRIFDPFYTTKPPGAGSGLGLFICRGVVDRHRGHIALVNRPEGGLVATVLLPLDPFEGDSASMEKTI